MKNLFRWDNPLIQLLTALADVILTNLLCLICSQVDDIDRLMRCDPALCIRDLL